MPPYSSFVDILIFGYRKYDIEAQLTSRSEQLMKNLPPASIPSKMTSAEGFISEAAKNLFNITLFIYTKVPCGLFPSGF
jgi:hypothetical protein